MTDLYRIKELEWSDYCSDCGRYELIQSKHGWVSVFGIELTTGAEIDWASPYGDIDQAKAAANDHHRKEVEKMLESVESGWISCEDRQPEKGSTKTKYAVLIEEDEDIGWDHKTWWTAFYGGFDQWYGGCDPISDGQRVTHWQPLPPQAPVEKGED